MNESPRILIITDEPMLLVDMLYEFEARGLTVVPGTRGDYEVCTAHHDLNAAVFDFRHPDNEDLKFASNLRQAGIPIVMIGGGSSTIPVEITGAVTCISKPVDFDELTGMIRTLSGHIAIRNGYERGGAMPFAQSIPADKS
ncbi:hypothetical protein SAMN05877838_1402 [Hoeflea halophila]|uniref:Response regulatory domain-containing protein n=1 Tax=Hoeflea halophila TaxID=714899 RepID=A0A286I8Z3_9HYPH|nr:response regulator [Hoeflea halophila]SOE16532.1 hypothetical protein SAMN05877838_1402 [Hoeflea halophila]